MSSGTPGSAVVWGRIRRDDGHGTWRRGLSRDDPHFPWWVARNLAECFTFGYAFEMSNDGPEER